MSQALNPTTIASSGQSTLIIPGDVGQYTAIDIYNATIFDLKMSGLPQGSIWLPMNSGVVLDPKNGLPAAVYFSPGQTTSQTASPANTVLTTLYLQGEPHPDYGPYVNTRYTNVAGSISVADITAQFLEGDAQTRSLTELDDTLSGNPILLPATGANTSLFLGARDASNTPRTILELSAQPGLTIECIVIKGDGSGNFGDFEAGNIYAGGAVKLVNSIFTAGSFGVPAVLRDTFTTGITSTAQQTLYTYTPPADGTFMIPWGFRPNNGVSGNIINIVVTFNDRYTNAAQTDGLAFLATTGVIFATNNGVSFANGVYMGLPLIIEAKGGTAITFKYRDPTNTPNDSVYAGLIQIG